MTPPVIMQASLHPNLGRWGDYSGTSSDPLAPGAFWGAHEYVSGGIWATWVGLMGPCSAPTAYCTAKTTSLGTTPSIGSTGEPSVGVNDFELTMTGGPPGKHGIVIWASSPANLPFLGGTKCVGAPTQRTPIFSFDGSGAASRPTSVTLDDLGQTRYAQFWFRDPLHPDGTTMGLSDGLQYTVCP
jgi:hypothetical protein